MSILATNGYYAQMEQTVIIEKIVAGGKGLGRLANGQVVLVAGALPGESLRVRVTQLRRGYVEAEIVQINETSPDRRQPPCPYYGRCGGCNFQHAAYPAQLAIKHAILNESLERARLPLPSESSPTLASPESLGYRFRLRLHLDQSGNLGFHQVATNTVVPIQRCLLATEPINRVLAKIAASDWPKRLSGQVKAVEIIQSPENDQVMLILHPHHGISMDHRLQDQMAALADVSLIHHQHKTSPSIPLSQRFSQHGRDYRLAWDHRCFFQTNCAQNAQLVQLAVDLLPQYPSASTVLDLFCGIGNFTVPIALQGARVVGVEHNRRSVHYAEENSRNCGLTTTRFVAADVERYLQTLVQQKEFFDCILCDPPRRGLGRAASLLAAGLAPKHIITISCDPATLARDLARITADGYRLTRLMPVDMFPQTHHIESIGLLERN
ncbi:MAG: class I SAM-dependent RNA methyltransferase [Desulfobulbus oligotrophicus]|nr:class I SAM-dependent RNA methyltransferase [Desulfobulbus oligotrophicus]